MGESAGFVHIFGDGEAVEFFEAFLPAGVGVLRGQEHVDVAGLFNEVVEGGWESDTEQACVCVVGSYLWCLDPPFDVAVEHPVRVE